MTMRTPLAVAAALVVVLLAGSSSAQRIGSLAIWKKRVLDPKSVDLEIYPGAVFNMKFTIDQIRLDETKDLMAVYVIPMADVQPAAEFFSKQLGTPVQVTERGTMGDSRAITATANDPKRAGLSVRVEPAAWATGKGWIWLRRTQPAGARRPRLAAMVPGRRANPAGPLFPAGAFL
jgi:hypothetical protein